MRTKITDRLIEIYDTAQDLGVDPAAEKLGVTRETVRRAKREYVQLQSELAENKPPEIENNDFNISDRKLIDQLRSRFTDRELKAILNGSEQRPNEPCDVAFTGTKIKFGIIGDTHIGSKFFKPASLMLAFKTFKEENVDFILHVGDVTEGMSNRPGHHFELTEQGFHEQKQKAIELFSKTDIPIYAIDGNHDRWYIKSNGAKIVSDIADMLPNFHFVGHDKALVKFGKLNVMLFHGEDMGGGSLSLRGQRVIDALPETSKPHVVYTGHNHKYVTFEHRGVYVASIPSIQEQTDYLASKSVVAHTGFVITDIVFNGKEIVRYKVERFKT